MFSVNIDKIIKMNETDDQMYASVAENILSQAGDKSQIIAGIGNGVAVFKIASKFIENYSKILFVDADISDEIFLSKYRLGKNLNGILEYINSDKELSDLICVTNNEQIDIVFTGNVSELNDIVDLKAEKFFKEAKEKYDKIVVLSDKKGCFARFCDTTFIIQDEEKYDENELRDYIDKLEADNFKVLGVVIAE